MNYLIAFSLVGISASLFLGVLLLSKKQDKGQAHLFLGIFFLLVAIRLGKLVIQEYAPEAVVHVYFNIMHAAFLAMGPVIWLYIKNYMTAKSVARPHYWVHFIPSFILLVGGYPLRQVVDPSFWLTIYWLIQVHPIVYLVRALQHTIDSRESKKWSYSLITATFSIVLMNVLYFMVDFPFYLVTALLLIVTVYLFAYLAFNGQLSALLGKKAIKYQNLQLNSEKTEQVQQKIEQLLLHQKWYLKDGLKLSDISEVLQVSNHLVSGVINQSYGMSFPQYVNSLRIQQAQRQLLEEPSKKIISIALESGFSSLSAFNHAFKRITQVTPSGYRAQFLAKKSS
ncbi:AraC family transcriptional regulator [Flavobacteriaceae bacterium S356]|uniref:AraC family transcriptional regulator n=1 Tax=Asprobacillus argus TaxID=3076534 RepID=A0ABU3LEF5_9FLAO|nr:AraC family transcriptional regulator [Flavobacteriaceae bacterium S356]